MDEKVEKIQQELKKLCEENLKLEREYQQQFFLCRWLKGPDLELQSVKDEIARLKTRELEYLKLLQVAASIPPPVPELDWSKSLFYSKTVEKLIGANTPFEQYGLYASMIGCVYSISRSQFRSYHALKAIKFPPESEQRLFHSFLAGATGEQLRHAKVFAYLLRTRGFLRGMLFPIGFISYIVQKHRK